MLWKGFVSVLKKRIITNLAAAIGYLVCWYRILTVTTQRECKRLNVFMNKVR